MTRGERAYSHGSSRDSTHAHTQTARIHVHTYTRTLKVDKPSPNRRLTLHLGSVQVVRVERCSSPPRPPRPCTCTAMTSSGLSLQSVRPCACSSADRARLALRDACRHWPSPTFLEILLVICMPLHIRISRNFRGNMQVPAETSQKRKRKLQESCPLLRLSSPQLAAGEKTLPQNSHILSKSLIFRVPRRVAGSGTETGTYIFGYDPTSKILRTPHGLCGKFVSVCVFRKYFQKSAAADAERLSRNM